MQNKNKQQLTVKNIEVQEGYFNFFGHHYIKTHL